MGSGPSESYVKELEREAYAALLRAVYVKSNVDIMASINNSQKHITSTCRTSSGADIDG